MTGKREDRPRTTIPRLLWRAAGLLLVATGCIGLFVPLMPTTIFLILALSCFARSSPRMEQWLLDHPRFGPSLRAWRCERAVPRRAKQMACAGMLLGLCLFYIFVHPNLPLLVLVALSLVACAGWIVSRPEPDPWPNDTAMIELPILPPTRHHVPTRYGDGAGRARAMSLAFTLALHAVVTGGLLIRWHHRVAIMPPATPMVVTLMPLSAPPEPVQELPEGPQQVQKERKKKQPRIDPRTVVALASFQPARPFETPAESTEAAKAVSETTAPKTISAPPAPRAASDAEHSWEALLLTHLQKFRRYPAAARARREQGVAMVRFMMDRSGRVVSAALVRSSGSAALDKSALETLRRANPLPAIPKDRPAPLELTVPIEFFMR